MTVYAIIYNLSRPKVPPIHARVCANFWSKFRGLMLYPSIAENEGVLLVENRDSITSSTIHMFFMRFDIAAIWINSQNTVVDSKTAKAWQPMIAPSQPARYILETHPRRILDFHNGDKVKFVYD
ncbi:MAG: DUF192 domain-containing protein [Bellilinea sp.]|jgi:uncharacterized membrane protein (UPF0127 family)